METLLAQLIAFACTTGQPIDDFYSWTLARNYDYGAMVNEVRIATDGGPVHIWEFEHLMFVTRPASQHGQCARELSHD